MSDGWDWGAELPVLRAARVALRWLRPEDARDVFAVFSDPEVMRYWSSPPLQNLEAAAVLIRQIQALFASRALFQWGIALRPNDTIVGTCTLFHLDHTHRRGEIGFAVGRGYWGQGLASEAVETLLRFAFEKLNLHRIEADVDPRNDRSLRLLERQGFQREGFLRERYHVGAETPDTVFLGLLRREWTPRQAGSG